ncbi:uncharacterized protein LOC127704762 [Mytilus californianus]|uniref:uncharacterized protein LOC127704762 n=1 Tax=Mytilus californianus TaxID=6549 RepID=UPI0022485B94|nr:uncharacterized protein LOC127704762 [Mytilus californianus]XP_052064920.1 uncharacterized protein LOC127704762 [Mytilus californianus]
MSQCIKILQKIHSKEIHVDALGKAKQFALFSIARPHMRSFHSSWFCFFMAFTSWFGIQPLLPTIRKELGLSKLDLANSGIASVAATIAVRVIIGPLCDRFGPRRTMAGLLMAGAVPMALSGLIKDGTGLIVLRLFIGVLGGTFVPCQFWTSAMFSPKIVGTANAMVGGWGNLGGGFTFLLMPGLFQLMKALGTDAFLAWKLAVVVPAVICVILGISILFTTDDCPQGHWSNRKLPETTIKISKDKNDQNEKGVPNLGFQPDLPFNEKQNEATKETKVEITKTKDLSEKKAEDSEEKGGKCTFDGCCKVVTVVILMLQYGMCFGVEIAVNTVMNLYLLYRFKKADCVEGNVPFFNSSNMTTAMVQEENENECSILNQDTASLIASLFGLMNLFARALGGMYSDVLRKYLSLSGRLIAHFTCLVAEGIMLVIFSQINSISSAIGVMVLFSTCVQMTEGTTYAIVPYVSTKRIGIVAGLVGAGGNAGALIWNTIWRQYVETDPSGWFWLLGIIVLCGSILTFFIQISGESIWHWCLRCKSNKDKYEM